MAIEDRNDETKVKSEIQSQLIESSDKSESEKINELEIEIAKLNKKINELEPNVIAQEHRIGSIIGNLYRYFIQDTTNEEKIIKKRLSSIQAAVSWIFRLTIARTILISGGGIAAFITLWIGYSTLKEFKRQNYIVAQQYEKMAEQNGYMREQNERMRKTIAAETVESLLTEITEKGEKVKSGNSRSVYNGFLLDSGWFISPSLNYRIATLSESLTPKIPYGANFNESLSIERGLLLRVLVDAKVIFPLDLNPEFSNSDLFGANLKGANLAEAMLRFSNLSNVDLSKAFLYRTDFGAAILREANLSSAYLEGANLYNTVLSSANLDSAMLGGSDLRKAQLNGASLKGTILGGAMLDGADIGYAKLFGTDFSYAQLTSAIFISSNLWLTNLSGTDLRKAIFSNAIFRDVNLQKAKIDTTYQEIYVDDSLISFVPFALSQGAIAVDTLGNSLPKNLQKPSFYP